MMSIGENVLSAILHPIKWFANRKVEELGNTIAVRRAVFREIVRLHFDRYVHESGDEKLDPDRARGLREKVIEQEQIRFDWANSDPEQENVRSTIAKAVTMAAVPAPIWVALKELRAREPFDPSQCFVLEYRDQKGSTHHSTTFVAGLQKHFLFHKPFVFSPPSTSSIGAPLVAASIHHEVSKMIDERLKDEPAGVSRFEQTPGMPDLFRAFQNLGG
jgi:hypothetical protein